MTFFDVLVLVLGAPGHEIQTYSGEEERDGFALTLGLCAPPVLCWEDKRKELSSRGDNVSVNFCHTDAV